MAKTKPFASLHLSILHIFHMVLTASSRISLTNQNVFRAPSLRWRKGFPARSRKFPAPPNRENFGSTLKALRNLWVYFRKLPEKISNTLQISLRAGNSSPRSVRGGLRRQPVITYLILQVFLSFQAANFLANLRGLLVPRSKTIRGRDGFTHDFGPSRHENLSGAISWFTFFAD
jgi:hypothetical protein